MSRRIRDSQTAGYIDLIFDTFMELRGDRKSGDDAAVLGGLARLGNYKVVVIGYLGSDPNLPPIGPEGYRKSLRLMRLAEAFNKPVIMFVDIPPAKGPEALWPKPAKSSEAENPSSRRRQACEAIARNIEEMSYLKIPLISVITGQTNSAIAIDLCAADRILILEEANCVVPNAEKSSIAFTNDAGSLCLKAQDLLELDMVHRIVKPGHESTANALRACILEELDQLTAVCPGTLVQERLCKLQTKFLNFGVLVNQKRNSRQSATVRPKADRH